MILYSFDPGEKNTGLAVWHLRDSDLSPFQMPAKFGVFSVKQLYTFLDELRPTPSEEEVFIYEDYKIRNDNKSKGFNHRWNSGGTLRAIGAIDFRAFQLGFECIPQQASVRSVGAGYAKLHHDPKKHDKDEVSAMKHGYYYMVKNQIMLPRS